MSGYKKILKAVAEHIFQPLRDAFKCPIYVSSGYRSADLNVAIGGSVRSQHVEGRALDLDADVYGSVRTLRSSVYP